MNVFDYWQADDRRRDQYFYIGFALLAAVVNDYAVGRDLHLSRKLNWAASAYYYSMVHACTVAHPLRAVNRAWGAGTSGLFCHMKDNVSTFGSVYASCERHKTYEDFIHL